MSQLLYVVMDEGLAARVENVDSRHLLLSHTLETMRFQGFHVSHVGSARFPSPALRYLE